MIIAFTGHRPERLGGYDARAVTRLVRFAVATLEIYQPDRIITGMALGWDQAVAAAASYVGIPFDAYIPGPWQANRWPEKSRASWERLLGLALSVRDCGELKRYDVIAMDRRNKAMVDDCHLLLALWDGSDGGTANCLAYARPRRPIANLWAQWEQFA